jgi:hypothetical protein
MWKTTIAWKRRGVARKKESMGRGSVDFEKLLYE